MWHFELRRPSYVCTQARQSHPNTESLKLCTEQLNFNYLWTGFRRLSAPYWCIWEVCSVRWSIVELTCSARELWFLVYHSTWLEIKWSTCMQFHLQLFLSLSLSHLKSADQRSKSWTRMIVYTYNTSLQATPTKILQIHLTPAPYPTNHILTAPWSRPHPSSSVQPQLRHHFLLHILLCLLLYLGVKVQRSWGH